jgi:hypothetical protein
MPKLAEKTEQESFGYLSEERYNKIFPARRKPAGDIPSIPTSLAILESEKLSDLYTSYAAWREFTEDMVNSALAQMLHKKRQYDFSWDVEFLRIRNGHKTAKETDAHLATSKNLAALKNDFEEAELFHTLLQKKLESFNNCLTIISREITRRGLSEPR